MTGEYQHTLDSKGRLFIPAKLRDELGDTFTSLCPTNAAFGLTAPKAGRVL